jgi:hypothetical protein
MRHDPMYPLSMNEGERMTTPQNALHENSSPLSPRGESALSALSLSELAEQCLLEINAYRCGEPSTEVHSIELLRRATLQDDQEAWASLQQCFAGIVRGWLHRHSSRKVAARLNSEETYVALAFERFWQATVQQQVAFRTLAGALAYLRASLNGALLDTLRAYARPREVPLLESGVPGEPSFEDRSASLELWEILQRVLPSEREQRLAYLLYHCNLKPREIVHFCQEEWPDVQEVYRLRRTILERLLRQMDQLRGWFHLQGQV